MGETLVEGEADSSLPAGSLWLVATPIGNLRDLSARAVDVLRRAELLLAEDTRHTQHLLHACGIERKPTRSGRCTSTTSTVAAGPLWRGCARAPRSRWSAMPARR
jgi:hypothetical protein